MNLFKVGNKIWNLDHIEHISICEDDNNVLLIATTGHQGWLTESEEAWALYKHMLTLV